MYVYIEKRRVGRVDSLLHPLDSATLMRPTFSDHLQNMEAINMDDQNLTERAGIEQREEKWDNFHAH